MNYPFWIVPFAGISWIIGIIAIIHVFISHFAIGGGIFLAVTEQLAYKRKDSRIYEYLKKHSLFFLLLTTVFGVVSGVGIWWSISLGNPDATATLIQQYSLFWAIEYVVFATELATFFVYFYTWDRIPALLHLRLAWLYVFISILTLIIINGMLSFMLTPGQWLETKNWVDGYFNPTYWPGNLVRLVAMFSLAGMYVLLTSSRIKDPDFRAYMTHYSSKWFLPLLFIGPVAGYWYFTNLPQSSIDAIFTGLSGAGAFSILARALCLTAFLSVSIMIFAFIDPYLNPKGFSFKAAILFLILGLLVIGTSEWTREMLRKPYVIYNYMYANSLRKDQVNKVNSEGFLKSAKWANSSLPISSSNLEKGERVFRFQCMSCHTTNGYRGMKKLLEGRSPIAVRQLMEILRETDPARNPYSKIMPPLVGTDQEVDALTGYLNSISNETNRNISQDKP